MKSGAIVCSFSAGLDELTREQASNDATVLAVIDRVGKFSVFEATANPVIAKTMTRLFETGMVEDVGGAYPWTHAKLTAKGRAVIEVVPAKNATAQKDIP